MTEKTLAELEHTNPFTEEAFGDAMVYRRGPVVVTDGGTDDETASDRDRSTKGSDTQLSDIDHTPPHGEGVARDRIYERGRSENA